MALACVVIAPAEPIPAISDPDFLGLHSLWQSVCLLAWFERNRRPDELRREQRARDACSPARSAEEDAIVALARRHAETWARTRAGEPDVSMGAFAELAGRPSGLGLDALVGYRAWRVEHASFGARLYTDLGRGGVLEMGSPHDPEGELIVELVRARGGAALATWTDDRRRAILTVLFERKRERRDPSLWRAAPLPLDGQRDEGWIAALAAALPEGFPVDLAAVELQLRRRKIAARKWMAAFGARFAVDRASVSPAAGWAALDRAAAAWLRGAAEAPADRALLDALGVLVDGGPSARRVAEASRALAAAIGRPRRGPFSHRWRATDMVRAILEAEADREEGAVQVWEPSLPCEGEPSAAVSRLLARLPDGTAEDAVALAMVAIECEVWNAHTLVAPLLRLAEQRGGARA